MSNVVDLPRYFADYRRARGGGWTYEVKDRRNGCRVVYSGWSAGAKRDAKADVRLWLSKREAEAES